MQNKILWSETAKKIILKLQSRHIFFKVFSLQTLHNIQQKIICLNPLGIFSTFSMRCLIYLCKKTHQLQIKRTMLFWCCWLLFLISFFLLQINLMYLIILLMIVLDKYCRICVMLNPKILILFIILVLAVNIKPICGI
jgi:hypothetical protein